MRVTFSELAARELNEAAQYYELEQAGLGVAFLLEAQRCTEAVAHLPLAGRPVRDNIRRRLCRRFPYALLYTVNGNEVRNLAVMNLRRRPGYWVGRS